VKVSFFETARYLPPRPLAPEWPVPASAYDLMRALELFGKKVLPRIREI